MLKSIWSFFLSLCYSVAVLVVLFGLSVLAFKIGIQVQG